MKFYKSNDIIIMGRQVYEKDLQLGVNCSKKKNVLYSKSKNIKPKL